MTRSQSRFHPGLLLSLVTLSLTMATPAGAQNPEARNGWEMRVCADPDNFPVSSSERPGYENRIAAVIAEELGADLSFFWTTGAFDYVVDEHLSNGDCDLVMGAGEGVMDLLNTVVYYRSPHVFVFRRDSDPGVRSLDDPELAGLRVGTVASSVLQAALLNRGLGANVVARNPLVRTSSRRILDELRAGDLDLAVLYGPMAGYVARHEAPDLEVVPVAPELDPPLTQMFSVWTIGVRPGDESLRDRLNVALARRWDDVHEVLEEYGVPRSFTPQPRPPGPAVDELVRVGLVLPIATGQYRSTDVAATAARMGGLITEGWTDRDDVGTRLEIIVASAPDTASARRAALRLSALDSVVAVVGGLGPDQAQVLAGAAAEGDVLFFNIGDPADSLRSAETPREMFHIESSTSTYLERAVPWLVEQGHRRWFVVREDTAEGERLFEAAGRVIGSAAQGSQIVATASVQSGTHAYHELMGRIRDEGPDIVLLLLAAEDQEAFLAQYRSAATDAAVVGIPDAIGQTRDFHARLLQIGAGPGLEHRLALWETTLSGDASPLIERFVGRSGEPMDPAGWAAYAAVKITHQAVMETGTRDPVILSAYLERPETLFDLGKGVAVGFDPRTHELRQPLYIVRIEPSAEWGPQVSRRIGLSGLVAELPPLLADPVEAP